MSEYKQMDYSGALFKNDRKVEDRHPDYNGSCMIDGQEYWMNAWLKDGKNGKFFSFSFKRKQQGPAKAQSYPKPAPGPVGDDDVPF